MLFSKLHNMGPYRDTIKIVLLCVMWFSFSSATNIVGKQILTVFPYPSTLAMVQLMVINCFLGPTLTLLNVKESPHVSRRQFMRRVVPLGVGKIVASISAYVSILKVPVSYSHTGMFVLNHRFCYCIVYYSVCIYGVSQVIVKLDLEVCHTSQCSLQCSSSGPVATQLLKLKVDFNDEKILMTCGIGDQ